MREPPAVLRRAARRDLEVGLEAGASRLHPFHPAHHGLGHAHPARNLAHGALHAADLPAHGTLHTANLPAHGLLRAANSPLGTAHLATGALLYLAGCLLDLSLRSLAAGHQ